MLKKAVKIVVVEWSFQRSDDTKTKRLYANRTNDRKSSVLTTRVIETVTYRQHFLRLECGHVVPYPTKLAASKRVGCISCQYDNDEPWIPSGAIVIEELPIP